MEQTTEERRRMIEEVIRPQAEALNKLCGENKVSMVMLLDHPDGTVMSFAGATRMSDDLLAAVNVVNPDMVTDILLERFIQYLESTKAPTDTPSLLDTPFGGVVH